MLRSYPHLQMHTDLVDAHVYIFAHWVIRRPRAQALTLALARTLTLPSTQQVLDVLELKPHFSSAKFELLPYLVRKQFLTKENMPTPQKRPELSLAYQASLHADARRQLNNGAEFRCCCYTVPHGVGYCVRANTIPNYMQANLDVSKGGVTSFEKPPEVAEPPPKEGNFVLRSFSADCTRGLSVEVGARSTIKKTCVGAHCRIGSGVKMTNCILMDHVVIGDKVTMSNVVVCSNAEVREGASLKDAQVAAGVTVDAGAVVKGDALTGEPVSMEEEE